MFFLNLNFSGTSLFPWSGEVVSLPDEDSSLTSTKEMPLSDARLQYGVLDNGLGSNFVRYLPPSSFVSQSNVLAHCGSLGMKNMFLAATAALEVQM